MDGYDGELWTLPYIAREGRSLVYASIYKYSEKLLNKVDYCGFIIISISILKATSPGKFHHIFL